MSQAGILNVGGSTPGGAVDTLTGNSGGAVGPDASHNINVLGQYTTTVVGTPGSNTLTITPTSSGYPITPYVVGPVGQAGYQTIQSAIDAAHAAGGTNSYIFVQGGTYTENLVLYDTIFINGEGVLSAIGDTSGTFIVGTHTPALTGAFSFNQVDLVSATDIFFSNAAGSAQINVSNASIGITNGYLFNMPNWTGLLGLWNVDSNGTNDGCVNNPTGGAPCYFYEVGVGSGTGHTAQISGTFISEGSAFYCPVTFNSGSVIQMDDWQFQNGPVTFAGNSTGLISCARFTTGASPAITMSSSGNISITTANIDSTNAPAITGAGTGVLKLTDISFLNNKTISPTLNVSSGTGFFPARYTNHGVLLGEGVACINATNAGTNGQVLIGATNLDPAFATLTSSDNSISFTTGANTLSLQVASGTGVIKTITGDSGGAESPSAGNFNILGTGSITVAGSANTETVQLTGLTNHAVLVGAGTATITKVGPTATAGQVLQSAGAAADPAFSTATYPLTTTINQILYSSAANTVTGLATANQGVLTTGATGTPVITALATNGQLIIGSTAGVPAAATLSAGTGISITNGSNSITIATTGAGLTWTDVTGATQTLVAENGYVTDRGGGVTYTLPASGTLGDEIQIVGKLGLATITPNANQQILIGSGSGAVGVTGTAVSNNVGDCITLICITAGASTVWRANSVVGTWTLN